jgi:ketosteroid isomerase-like protein
VKTRSALAIAAIIAVISTVGACSGGEPPAASRGMEVAAMPEDNAVQLARLLDEFDPVALGNLLMDNARLLPPNVPAIDGRDAIVEYYKGTVANELDYEVTPLKRIMIGDIGLAEGTYRVKNLTSGTYVEEGKYMAIWVNQDGQWKVARMMTNTDYQVARTSVTVEEPEAVEAPAKTQ